MNNGRRLSSVSSQPGAGPSRRHFLRGLGVALALPWLESLPVFGQEAAGIDDPKSVCDWHVGLDADGTPCASATIGHQDEGYRLP